jgi:hypothetical protein
MAFKGVGEDVQVPIAATPGRYAEQSLRPAPYDNVGNAVAAVASDSDGAFVDSRALRILDSRDGETLMIVGPEEDDNSNQRHCIFCELWINDINDNWNDHAMETKHIKKSVRYANKYAGKVSKKSGKQAGNRVGAIVNDMATVVPVILNVLD